MCVSLIYFTTASFTISGDEAVPSQQKSLLGIYFDTFVQDMVDVNRQAFTSPTTLKIITWTLPVYLIARFSDDRIHESFYEPILHKNVSQLPDAFYHFTSRGVTVIMVLLLSTPLFEFVSEDFRRTSNLMAKGLLSVFLLRTFVKYSLKARASLRPWSQPFSACQRALGGFPSGHMAVITYLATLYGLEYGPVWGFPLSVFATLAGLASLNHNRHYASQLVGGAGLGVIYGYAVHKVLDQRWTQQLDVKVDFDHRMRPNLSIGYSF